MIKKREKSELAVLQGMSISVLSNVPVLGQIVAGWNAYKDHQFKEGVKEVIFHLRNKTDNLEYFFSDDWFKSDAGQRFTRKVIDCSLDAQIEDKRELFVNALINGVKDKDTTDLEKLKFVDMLRQLSRASLDILAELHKIYAGQVMRPNNSRRIDGSANLNRDKIVEQLSKNYNPYLIESSYEELKSVGLFSPNIHYYKQTDGSHRAGSSFSEGNYAYTDFTCRFIEFITIQKS